MNEFFILKKNAYFREKQLPKNFKQKRKKPREKEGATPEMVKPSTE